MLSKRFLFALGLSAGATIAIAQELPRFGSLKVLTNKEAVVQLQGSNTINYRIDVSSNLFDWQALATLRSSATNQYTDSFAPYLSSRTYRAATLEGTNILTG